MSLLASRWSNNRFILQSLLIRFAHSFGFCKINRLLLHLEANNDTLLLYRKISREEFVGTEKPKGKSMNTDAKAELAFNVFDKNHDGYITKNEMLRGSKNLTKEQVM